MLILHVNRSYSKILQTFLHQILILNTHHSYVTNLSLGILRVRQLNMVLRLFLFHQMNVGIQKAKEHYNFCIIQIVGQLKREDQ